MKKISLVSLCNRFVTSATKQKYSEKKRRIFTLLLSPIWIIGLVITLYISMEGFIELPTYIKSYYLYQNGKPIFGERYMMRQDEWNTTYNKVDNSTNGKPISCNDSELKSKSENFLAKGKVNAVTLIKRKLNAAPITEPIEDKENPQMTFQTNIDRRYTEYISQPLEEDQNLDGEVLDVMKERVMKLLSIPIYILVFFIAPWIAMRTVYWIKESD